uniref:DUF3592 domain-containing protein n=1 Tax=viral metagenome TaxID=1070528 RepID=A0A6C0LRP4_9ZZZZ
MSIVDYLSFPNIAIIILAVIGLSLFFINLKNNFKICKIVSWPRIDAVILSSKSLSIDHSTSRLNFESPYITYEYNVNGKTYQSDRFGPFENTLYEIHDLKNISSKFSPGTVVSAYYNPKNPAESYLHKGHIYYHGLVWGIIIILLCIGLTYHYNGDIWNEFNGSFSRGPEKSDMNLSSVLRSLKKMKNN